MWIEPTADFHEGSRRTKTRILKDGAEIESFIVPLHKWWKKLFTTIAPLIDKGGRIEIEFFTTAATTTIPRRLTTQEHNRELSAMFRQAFNKEDGQ
jgi:hypothetical protein